MVVTARPPFPIVPPMPAHTGMGAVAVGWGVDDVPLHAQLKVAVGSPEELGWIRIWRAPKSTGSAGAGTTTTPGAGPLARVVGVPAGTGGT